MSLIADALKTAQREKELRESKGARLSAAAVLIPLKDPSAPFDAKRALWVVGASVAVVAAVLVFRESRQAAPKSPTLPAVTSAILSEAIADSATPSVRAQPSPRVAQRGSVYADGIVPIPRRASTTVALAQPQPTQAAGDTIAVLQGQSDSTRSAAAALPDTTGRLRIAVERSRPTDAGLLFSEALAAHRAGDLATARTLYERVLAIAPRDADALNNLGILLSSEREFERALVLLRRAATIAPRNAGVWNNIGTAFREQGRSSEAIAAFRQALSIDPQHQGARVGLAQQYLAIGSLPQARELLEHVLSANPASAEAHYTLGQVLEAQGDRPNAIREYEEFLRVAPSRFAAHAERVRAHIGNLGSR
jgi:Tfp pilus assembly protein PilF